MAAGLPTASVVEVKLNGVWTDISSFVKQASTPIVQHQGRGSEFDDGQPGTLDLTLDGIDGRFMPDSPTIVTAGVLSSNPLYPYFVEDTPLRWTVTKGAAVVLFNGRISAIVPVLASEPTQSTVVVTAVDTLGQMSRGTLLGYVAQQILVDGPTGFYPLTEPAGAARFTDTTGRQPVATLQPGPAGGITSGDTTPATVVGDSAVFVVGTALSSGSSILNFPASVALGANSWTLELCANIRAKASSGGELFHQLAADGLGNTYGLTINYTSAADGTLSFKAFVGLTVPPGIVTEMVITASSPVGASAWPASGFYHVAVTLSADGKTGFLYVNGLWSTVTLGAAVTWLGGGIPQLKAANASLAGHDIGNVAFYNTALSGNRLGVHASGSTSTGAVAAGPLAASTVAAMATDVASWAGFTPTLEAGFGPQSTSSIATTGRTPLDALQVVVRGEGGLLYDDGTGLYLRARSALRSSTVKVTIDMEDDLEGPPTMSRSSANKVGQATATSVAGAITVTDATVIAQVGKAATATLETSLADPGDLYAVASNRIAASLNVKTRISQVRVNLMTAKNDLYAAFLALRLGDRVRLANAPQYMGVTYVDAYVLGWELQSSYEGFVYILDLGPADAPAEVGFDTGRFASDGTSTCGVLTASGTTVVITTPSGPTWDTAAGSYPSDLWINGERVTLTSAPGGAASPQTFTGVTRGQPPTMPRAHAAGEPVEVWDALRFSF